jgi:4-hydroxy-4-methyl-2-oxoglutarate aldolase
MLLTATLRRAQLREERMLQDQVASTSVADALAELGTPGASGAPGTEARLGGVLTGVAACTEAALVGPAFTVLLCPPGDSDVLFNAYIDDVPPGAVIVVDNGARRGHSVFGGLMAAEAARRGAVGAVVNGDVRDVEEARQIGFGLFARGRTPVSGRPFARLAATQEPLDWEGVTIRSGDMVVADGEGVVVVPLEHAAAVLERARAIEERDARIAADVATGIPLAVARAERAQAPAR